MRAVVCLLNFLVVGHDFFKLPSTLHKWDLGNIEVPIADLLALNYNGISMASILSDISSMKVWLRNSLS